MTKAIAERDDKYYEERGPKSHRVKLYDSKAQRLVSVGTFRTEAEAKYRRQIARFGHHWTGLPEVIPNDILGFTYRMTHRATGRMYLGAKQMLFWNGPTGGYKCSDPRDSEFDRDLWVESDWREYTSSSKVLKTIVDAEGPWAFDYEVIELHHNKLDLFYNELRDQMRADVLKAVDENGDYVYLNEQIMGVEYRPKVPRAKLIAARVNAESQLRDYYLNPKVCTDCSEVIPYGQTQCANKPMFGGGTCKR